MLQTGLEPAVFAVKVRRPEPFRRLELIFIYRKERGRDMLPYDFTHPRMCSFYAGVETPPSLYDTFGAALP